MQVKIFKIPVWILLSIILIFVISGCSVKSELETDAAEGQPAPMVLVPGGYFTMGFRFPAWAENSQTYTVWLDDYYIEVIETFQS